MYFVSRQIQWPDGTHIVEISAGSIDFCNPGMLVPKYSSLGEGQEFADPREAVEAGLAVRKAWQENSTETIEVGYGATMGYTMPFDASTEEELKAWANKRYEKLPKCGQCGDILGKNNYRHDFCDDDRFCSESCAEQNYYHLFADVDEAEPVEEMSEE